MTFSGRQLRGRQLTNFKKSNTNSWRFFDANKIKGVLKFPPSEVNNALVQEAEKRFDQNFNAKKEERTKRKCKATTIHITEEVSGKVEGNVRNTAETEASDVIKSDTIYPLLAGGTQISGDSNIPDSIYTTPVEPPLDMSSSNISTSDTLIQSTNAATTNSVTSNNDSNISNSDHRDTSDNNLRPQHINSSHSIPEHTIANKNPLFLTSINGMNGLQESNVAKEDALRLIEYPIHNSKDIIENIVIEKTVTAVATSVWTSVVNIVRKNTDIMRLFSSHKKRNSTQSSCVQISSHKKSNSTQSSFVSVNPESDSGTFVTSLALMNILTDVITDHVVDLDNSKSGHINDELALSNINNNNTLTSAINSNKNNHISNNNTNTIAKSIPITPQPPSLSKPSIKSLRQRNITPHNPNPNQIQMNPKNVIPSTNNTHSSPTPPLGIKKRSDRNDLHTKATTRQPKITTKDNNDEDKHKLIKFEDYQNLNIAKEFKRHLIKNGHRIPHFLENIVISNMAPLKKKINKNSDKNKDSDKNDDDDDDNIVNSEIAAPLNNDENNDNNNDDNHEKNSDDENDIVNSKTVAALDNDEINDNNNDNSNDDKNNIEILKKAAPLDNNESNNNNNDDNNGRNDDEGNDIEISKLAAPLDNNESNDNNNDDNNDRNDKNDNDINTAILNTAPVDISIGATDVLTNSVEHVIGE
jgi:hypothetical protein